MQYRNQIGALKSEMKTLVKRCREAESLSDDLKSMNFKLLEVTKHLQSEHTKQNRLLRKVLQGPKTFINSGEFEAQLTEELLATRLPTRPTEQQPRVVPRPSVPLSRRPRTDQREIIVRPSSADVSTDSTLSTSRTQTDSTRSDDEPPRRTRPFIGVPTALFRAPEGNTSSSSWSEYGSQPFVVDRDDGRGTNVEYRPSRSSQSRHNRNREPDQ